MQASGLLRGGVGLGLAGALAAFLDLLFAGCNASGPCQPVPPVPIVVPVVLFALGLGLAIVGIWSRRSKPG